MKRWAVILTLLMITIVNTLWRSTEEIGTEAKKVPQPHLSQTNVKLPKLIHQEPASVRVPASAPTPSIEFERPTPNPLISRDPQSENAIKIGNSFTVLDHVFALPKDKFQTVMGTRVSEFKNLIFYKPTDLSRVPSGSTPVAMNTTTLKLYPVSQIIHLKNVDALLRSQLLNEGAKEYYYQSRLKMMSIEAPENSIIQTYRDFLNRGLNAKLEVLKDPPTVK